MTTDTAASLYGGTPPARPADYLTIATPSKPSAPAKPAAGVTTADAIYSSAARRSSASGADWLAQSQAPPSKPSAPVKPAAGVTSADAIYDRAQAPATDWLAEHAKAETESKGPEKADEKPEPAKAEPPRLDGMLGLVAAMSRIAEPTVTDAQAALPAALRNAAIVGGTTAAGARQEIADFLRHEPEVARIVGRRIARPEIAAGLLRAARLRRGMTR